MKKLSSLALAIVLAILTLVGCSMSGSEGSTLIIAWYPNESGEELKAARDEIGKLIEKATGKKVEHKLTTDYVIAIEAVATGSAHLAFTGAEGYIQAHRKNPKVLPVVVNSGESGTLSDAMYYSWMAVKKGDEGRYKSGDSYSIENIQGKRFSFVSNSSTSGFRVPTADIIKHFSKKEQWKNLKSDDLIQGGKDKFFSEVLFGGSHQGSAVNLLTGKADIAAFCDTCVFNYVELAVGKENTPGAIYRVRKNADDPFKNLGGQEFVIIAATPVLNAPFIANTEKLSEKTFKAILTAMTSDETAKNPQIFVPKDSKFKGMFKAPGRFVEVKDEWFNPIRDMAKN